MRDRLLVERLPRFVNHPGSAHSPRRHESPAPVSCTLSMIDSTPERRVLRKHYRSPRTQISGAGYVAIFIRHVSIQFYGRLAIRTRPGSITVNPSISRAPTVAIASTAAVDLGCSRGLGTSPGRRHKTSARDYKRVRQNRDPRLPARDPLVARASLPPRRPSPLGLLRSQSRGGPPRGAPGLPVLRNFVGHQVQMSGFF
jgi:hypothetical protein